LRYRTAALLALLFGFTILQASVALKGGLDASTCQRVTVSGTEARYVSPLPTFLQWEKNYLTIVEEPDAVVVTGPYGALLGLKRFLTLTFDGN
jgi:hypothetical protein